MKRIRELAPAERPAARDLLLELSPEDRCRRFGGAMSDLSIAGYFDHLDWTRAAALGAFHEDRLVGLLEIVECAPDPGDPDPDDGPEVAIAVAAPFRRQGIGGALFRSGLALAARRGADHVIVRFRPGNEWILKKAILRRKDPPGSGRGRDPSPAPIHLAAGAGPSHRSASTHAGHDRTARDRYRHHPVP